MFQLREWVAKKLFSLARRVDPKLLQGIEVDYGRSTITVARVGTLRTGDLLELPK